MELSEAAYRIGVHYQTAYRWVREGSLPAAKVSSRYEISEEALETFIARRNIPIPPRSSTKVRDWDELSRRFLAHLLAYEDKSAQDQVLRLCNGGVDVVDIIVNLVSPALGEMGRLWERGNVSTAEEHRATRLATRVLDTVPTGKRGRPHGKVLLATAVGDRHELPVTMAEIALHAHRWITQNLGTEVPMEDLAKMAEAEQVNFVVISLTNPFATTAALRTRDYLKSKGFPVLLGGPGRPVSELVDELHRRAHTKQSPAMESAPA